MVYDMLNVKDHLYFIIVLYVVTCIVVVVVVVVNYRRDITLCMKL